MKNFNFFPEYLRTLITKFSNNFVNSSSKVILGGPCICFAKGDPYRLTIQDLIDTLLPVAIAIYHKCPVFIYFQSYESDLMAEFMHYDPQTANYNLMKDFLIKGLEIFFDKKDLNLVSFIDTRETFVHNSINQTVKELKSLIFPQELYGLYSNNNGDYPKGKDEEHLMLKVYYRNISLYDRNFLKNYISFTKDLNVYFIENETQLKAIKLVCNLSRNQEFNYATYLPALNRQAKEMCMGNRNHKIELRSTIEQIKLRSNFENLPFVRQYYEIILSQNSIVEIMYLWKKAVII